MANDSLAEAVNKAVAEVQEKVEAREEPREKETSTHEENDSVEVEVPGTTERPKITKEALDFLKALDNPRTARQAVEALAAKFGRQVTEGDKTVTEAKKDALSDLKEGVDPSQHFLIDALGPAIQKLIKAAVEENIAPLREQANTQEVREAQREVDLAMGNLWAKHKISAGDRKAIEAGMNKIADRIHMAPGTSLNDYVDDLYTIYARDKIAANAVEKTVNKINRNAKEATPASSQVSDEQVRRGSALPTLDEALKAGFRGDKLF